MPLIFKISFGHLLIQLMNIMKVQTQIPIESIDYWISNISPRCAINIIYFNFRNDFIFESTHEIPVMFVPLEYHHDMYTRFMYLIRNKFHNSSLRFFKAECYFSIIYYKVLESFTYTTKKDLGYLDDIMMQIAYGFPYLYYDSNTTYSLILYNRNQSSDGGLQSILGTTFDLNVALVYVTNSSRYEYNVYCRTPSTAFEVAAVSLVNEDASIVDQNFTSACSAHYTFVVLGEYGTMVYDPARLDYEHDILFHILGKVNTSTGKRPDYSVRHMVPAVILKDFEQSLLFFPTFDSYVRIFTCHFSPVLSFNFYISAFEKSVWISIALSGTLLAIFLNYQIYYNISHTVNFSSVLFYFSIFTEEAFSIPSIIDNNRVYRTATILWLLTTVVLTNTYVSHVISGLNAPLTGEKLRSTEDLYGNSTNATEDTVMALYNTIHLTRQSKLFTEDIRKFTKQLQLKQSLTNGFTFLSEPMRLPYPEEFWLNIGNPYVYRVPHDILMQINSCNQDWVFRERGWKSYLLCGKLYKLMAASNKYYPPSHTYKRPWNSNEYARGAVEEELVKCQKSVYLEQSNQLEFEYISENYKKKRFYYLQDQILSRKSVWGFYNLQKSRIPFYFSMFLQSGIYYKRHKLKLLKDHHKRRNVTAEIINRTQRPEVLDLTSSIQTIFILFAVMSLLAKLAFAAELGYLAICKWLDKVKNVVFNEAKIQKRFFQLSKHFYPRSET